MAPLIDRIVFPDSQAEHSRSRYGPENDDCLTRKLANRRKPKSANNYPFVFTRKLSGIEEMLPDLYFGGLRSGLFRGIEDAIEEGDDVRRVYFDSHEPLLHGKRSYPT